MVYFTDGANLDIIEQNFSDWSDDSDDDILNQPGEPVSLFNPFPSYRRFLMPLQQTAF